MLAILPIEHYLLAAPWIGKIMDVNIKISVYTLLRYKAIPYKLEVLFGAVVQT